MPRNGSDIYYIPPGTEGFPDTTIESAKYNTYIHDVEEDLNRPRPVVAGGTGANDADEALSNLGAEKSSQKVVNYDTHIFKPGSFYSDSAATASPVSGHAFVGWVVSSDIPAEPPANQNVVVHARDQTTTVPVPGRVYVREKKAGVWGPWSIDGSGIAGDTPPLNPPDGALWWDNITGQLYIYYRDIDTAQWVIASPVPDPAQFLLKAGDKMEGTLELQAPPITDLQAANKKYVDDAIVPAGSVMLFVQSNAPTGWTKRTDLNDYALRLVNGNITQRPGNGFEFVFSQAVTQGHALSATEQANMNVVGTFSGATIGNQIVYRNDGAPNIGWAYGSPQNSGLNQAQIGVEGSITGTALGNGATGQYHTHPIALNVNYVDVIMATKN